MTPAPSLQELIETVRTDAASIDPLDQLATASQTVAEVEEVTDAMLSHFVDQCRRSGRSWTEISKALGVTKQAAHKRFSPVTFERFTARAKAVLDAASAEAKALGHNYVGTEHLLLGLFADPEAIAAKALKNGGVTHDEVEEKLLDVTPRTDMTVTTPPFTPRAATALGRALSEALNFGHNYIGTEHLLLALFSDEESLAAKILADLQVEHDAVKADIVKMLTAIINTKH